VGGFSEASRAKLPRLTEDRGEPILSERLREELGIGTDCNSPMVGKGIQEAGIGSQTQGRGL
jgi:hypothetical protein